MAYSAGDNAFFTQGSGTITLGGTLLSSSVVITVGNMVFEPGAGAYVIEDGSLLILLPAGNSLALNGNITNNSASTQTFNIPIALSAGNHAVTTAGNILLSGGVSGSGGITKLGAGTLTLSGANTYSGGTFLQAGTLLLTANERLANTGLVNVSNGTFNLGGFSETVGSVTLQGGLISNGNLTGTGYQVQAGTISANLLGSGSLNKTTAGLVTLSGNNNYSGSTTVQDGVLAVDGTITNSATTVQSGGTLTGFGSLGALTVNTGGTLNAGSVGGTGTLTTGNLLVDGTFRAEIGIGGSDLVSVIGAVDIAGASLDISLLGGFSPALNSLYVLLANDGADAITGTFNGLANGATFTSGGQAWQIFYTGNAGGVPSISGGNDIVIRATPEPGVPLLAGLGLLSMLCRRRRQKSRTD